MEDDRKAHWDTVYETKEPHQVSWTQETPQTSLDFITSFGLDKTAKIIDIGGGDSKLVDHLLDLGYTNITVLDISALALERAKKRLGSQAEKINWVVSDITDFEPTTDYDIWHDRAAFHFLTADDQIKRYVNLTQKHTKGFLIIGTFSDQGPLKCSGLEIKQYTKVGLAREFEKEFNLIESLTLEHTTPFDTQQHFLFCSFSRKQ